LTEEPAKREDRLGVGDLGREDDPLGLLDRKYELFRDLVGARWFELSQTGRTEEGDPLVREARRREEGDESGPAFRDVSGLLPKFAPRAGEGIFAWLDLPGRDLPQLGSNSVTILADEEDVAVRQDRYNRRRARMDDDLSRRLSTVRRFDPIDVNVEQSPVEDVLVRDDADRFRRRCSPPRSPGCSRR
jgi:hypothetical protein